MAKTENNGLWVRELLLALAFLLLLTYIIIH